MFQYAALAAAAKVFYDQFSAYGESRWLYALAAAGLVCAVAFEMAASGCTAARCTQSDNRAARKVEETGRAALCAESRRVTWRVAYILAFLVFTALNVVRLVPRENLAMLVVTFALAHGTLGFIAFHRYAIWC